MKLKITGKELMITEALNDYVEKKLSRIEKYFDDLEADVTLRTEKNEQIAEMNIYANGESYRAVTEDKDLYASIDKDIDILEGQIRKSKTRKEKMMRDDTLKVLEVKTESRPEVVNEIVKTSYYSMQINNIYEITGLQDFKQKAYVEDNLSIHDVVLLTQAGTESINLQRSDTLILYDIPFSIKTILQLLGRITRIDSKYSAQYIHFIEASNTIDTYKRLLISIHGDIINKIFGEIETLPVELTLVDQKIQQKLRNKLLWSFKSHRLPTEEEIENIIYSNLD